jgi:hypothetical protein
MFALLITYEVKAVVNTAHPSTHAK